MFSTLVGSSDSQLYVNKISTQTLQVGSSTIGIGIDTHSLGTVGNFTVAVGSSAGQLNHSYGAVGVGAGAQQTGAGACAVALGFQAGTDLTLTPQAPSSIVINATGDYLNNTIANSFVVAPVRNTQGTHGLFYNTGTKEISYSTIATAPIISSFSTAFVSSMFTTSSITTTEASISTANISTMATSYLNALGTVSFPGSISTIRANISTAYISSLSTFNTNSQLANISTLTIQNINNLGGGFGGSLSSFAMSVSTANISTFSTNFMTARGASISTATISSFNGTPATYGMPKWYTSNISTITPQTGTLTSYFTTPLISSIQGGGFVANANISFIGATAGNTEITALMYLNGLPMGLSTVKTNSGLNHIQQINLTLASTFTGVGAASSTNQLAVYVKNNNGTPGIFSTIQGNITLTTNLI